MLLIWERLFRPEKLKPDNEMLSEARKIYASRKLNKQKKNELFNEARKLNKRIELRQHMYCSSYP